jgi:hypothetical protein
MQKVTRESDHALQVTAFGSIATGATLSRSFALVRNASKSRRVAPAGKLQSKSPALACPVFSRYPLATSLNRRKVSM